MTFFDFNNKNEESCQYLYQDFQKILFFYKKNINRNQDNKDL